MSGDNKEFQQKQARTVSEKVKLRKFKNINTKNLIKNLIKARLKNPADLDLFKRKVAKKYKIRYPRNIELLQEYRKFIKKKSVKISADAASKIENLLKTRPVRSLSGIVNVSLLTKPYPCPGNCLYCPSEKGMPKSYLSDEPAAARAKALKFNPHTQTKKRIEILDLEGHPTDKIDLRIIGGTWSFYPKKYQEWFVKKCFDAANGKTSKNLETAKKLNENAKNRLIGISIETRPDFIDEKEVKQLRKLGVTKVEMGVQSIYDDILKINNRGDTVASTVKATKLLKDAGFKVSYQIMLNLPGSSPKKDIRMFKELFKNPDFKPDLLKIYPCAVLKESPLYRWFLKKRYKPYSQTILINAVKNIKKIIPYYVRIERVIRDIPSRKTISGPVTNLRQIIEKDMRKNRLKCRCIRCREIKENYNPKEKVFLFREDYFASRGKEIFLSFEDKKRDKIYSLLKLRIPSCVLNGGKNIIAELNDAAIIREVHTYGQSTPVSKNSKAPQHKGLGKKLIIEAEKITKKEFGLKKIAVISGVGVRPYYRRLGYKLKNEYMVKKI